MDEGNTWVNALIGAVSSVVLSGVVPFGPLLGGAIAGYLEGGDRSDGLRVGLIAGLLAMIPIVFFGFVMFSLFTGFFLGGMGPGMGGGFPGVSIVFLLFLFVLSVIYVVGLSAAGGWLGNYVKYDTDIDM